MPENIQRSLPCLAPRPCDFTRCKFPCFGFCGALFLFLRLATNLEASPSCHVGASAPQIFIIKPKDGAIVEDYAGGIKGMPVDVQYQILDFPCGGNSRTEVVQDAGVELIKVALEQDTKHGEVLNFCHSCLHCGEQDARST